MAVCTDCVNESKSFFNFTKSSVLYFTLKIVSNKYAKFVVYFKAKGVKLIRAIIIIIRGRDRIFLWGGGINLGVYIIIYNISYLIISFVH